MKRQVPPHLSDEKLNAFIDDELDFEEKEQLFLQLGQNDSLNRETHELRQLGALLRHAYRTPPPPPQHSRRGNKPGPGLSKIAAATGLLTIGALAGWYGNESLSTETVPVLAMQQPSPSQGAVAAEQSNLLLHISASDPVKMAALLDYAEQTLVKNRRQNLNLHIEVVANDGGIDMLRRDTSPFPARIASLLNEYNNISFSACSNALRRLREQGITVKLLSGIRQDHTAIDSITNRIEQGWRYLKV